MDTLIPTLTTDRLILRPWREDDLDALCIMMNDPDSIRYTTPDGKPQERMVVWRTMASMIGHWHLRGFGMWAVVDRHSGDFVGRVGPIRPEGWPQLEVGWGLTPAVRGKGYGSEAAVASMRWMFNQRPDMDRIVHHIVEENTPSIALAERLGSSWDGAEMVTLFGHHARVYAQSRAAFADRWGL
jgi:RimJ/RimL family protein N-acetyltransferase